MVQNRLVTTETENVPFISRDGKIVPSCRSIVRLHFCVRPDRRESVDHAECQATRCAARNNAFIVVAKSRCDCNGQWRATGRARSLAKGSDSYSRRFCMHDNETKLLPHSKQHVPRESYDFHFYSEMLATPSAWLCNKQFMQHTETFVHLILIPEKGPRWKEIETSKKKRERERRKKERQRGGKLRSRFSATRIYIYIRKSNMGNAG